MERVIGVGGGATSSSSGKVGRNMRKTSRNVKRPMSAAKEKLIAFRVSDEMHEYLQSEADARGMSVSSLIRQAVLFLKNH